MVGTETVVGALVWTTNFEDKLGTTIARESREDKPSKYLVRPNYKNLKDCKTVAIYNYRNTCKNFFFTDSVQCKNFFFAWPCLCKLGLIARILSPIKFSLDTGIDRELKVRKYFST